jgi:CII-binding regulator of phage lambda lysogenization HflD
MADLIPPMLIKLQADVSELKAGLAGTENAIKGVDKSVQQASSGMANFATKVKQIGASIGIAFAGTQVLQFGRDVIAQAMEAEAQQQRLYQLMKVGTGATDEQIASLNAQADALERVGVVTGSNITQTQSQLATFNLQTDTIKRLTPAILDYVTAEKGANASADEFKQMTNGLAQALNGNFGSLTRVGFVLDDHTKKLISSGTEAERSAAIVEVLNSTYKGFNEELRNTPAGQMQALRNDFDKIKEDLGKKLLPALLAVTGFLTGTLFPALRTTGKFFQENADAIKLYSAMVLTLVASFYAYRAALVVTKVAQQVFVVMQTIMKGATLASIASTNGLAASMLLLNAAIRANPIGLIITGIIALGAAFVYAWKNSETFRAVVVKAMQAVLNSFAKVSEFAGKFFNMLGKIPGMGWAKSIGKGLDDISNKITATSNKLALLQTGAMGIAAKQDAALAGRGPGSTGGTGGGTSGGGGGGLDDKAKKKLADYKKDVDKIYKDMYEVAQNARDKAQSVLEDRNDKFIKAQKNHDEKVLDINKNFTKRSTDLRKQLDDKLADLQANSAKRSADLTKTASDKQLSIIQESVNRLRNAFASSTAFSIADVFGGGKNAAQGIEILKKNLEAARKLQENAATLAGLGYSQTFIEEVVKQGPKAGNEIAQALKDASPEATKELQDLYGQVVSVSNNGLDDLAKSMNAGGQLATQELMDAYTQVAVDLKASLAEVDAELKKSMAEANRAYTEAMAEAKILRDEALADASKTLQEALLEAQKDYEKAIDEINKSTMKKLEDLKVKLAEVAALMRAIGAAQAASAAMANAPTTTPVQTRLDTLQSLSDKIAKKTGTAPINITQTFNSKLNAGDVAREMTSAIKFGEVVKVSR